MSAERLVAGALGTGRLTRRRPSRVVAQTAVFASASAGASLLAAVATAILARALPTEDFGAFSFALSFLLFVALFFEFGFFVAAARTATSRNALERRGLVGASLLAYVPLGLAYSLTVFGLSYLVDGVFDVHTGSAVRSVAPLAFVYPFVLVGMLLAQGVDRLHVFSVSTLVLQFAFIALLGVVFAATGSVDVREALWARTAAVALAGGILVGWLRPRFQGSRPRLRQLAGEARSFGFRVYVGRIFGTGTYNMDVLMLAVWTSPSTVGFYSLAAALAAASGLPVSGMASALFPRMGSKASLDRKWLSAAWIVGLGCAATAWLLASPVVDAAFSGRYAPAAGLVLPLALAQALRGVTGIYNWFLTAHARGRDLQTSAFVLAGSNLLFNFALIPAFGAQGAAWASLLALAANLGAHVVFYRRWLRVAAAPPLAGAAGALG